MDAIETPPKHSLLTWTAALGACLASLGTSAFLSGCAPPLDVPQPEGRGQIEIGVSGAPAEGGVASVLRFEVPGAGPSTLRLFEGSLSEYYERRIRDRDLPESLLAREVPALAWSREPEAGSATGWLRNIDVLVPGQRYSLAALGEGLLLEVDAAQEQPSYVPRVWPPDGVAGRSAVFCPGRPVDSGSVKLDGCASEGSIAVGIGETGLLADQCFTLSRLTLSTDECLAPLSVADLWLPSTLLVDADSGQPDGLECEFGELPLANGCVGQGDAYVAIRKPLGEMWVLALDDRVIGPEVGDSLVIRNLASDHDYSYSLIRIDTAGDATRESGTLRTLSARPKLVLNEVLANPNGPEPAQEWIELTNVGTQVASVEGLVLQDGAGEVDLPAIELQPGGYALLVTPEYDRAYPFDLSPSKDVQLIVVEQLGRSGLSNSGEPLILRSVDGELLSAIPPLKQDKPGYSVARRTPELTDVLTSFQIHGPPGASPGEANYFDEAEK